MVQTGNIVYRINRAHGLPSLVHELTERISTRRVSNLTRSIYCEVWHPLRVRVKPTTFPVVSADSDHRLLSCNPSGCAEVSQLFKCPVVSLRRFLSGTSIQTDE